MYIAIDGNSVGARLQQLILEEKLDELTQFSHSIKDTLSRFAQIIETHGGIVYMNGGDNLFAACTRECAQIIAEYVAMENQKNPVCYSLAVGEHTQDTYIGLKYAKSSNMHYIEVTQDGGKMVFRRML